MLRRVFQTGDHFQLTPTPPAVITSTRGGHESRFAVYDIKALDIDGMFNIAAVYSSSRVYGVNIPPVLFANRYIIGRSFHYEYVTDFKYDMKSHENSSFCTIFKYYISPYVDAVTVFVEIICNSVYCS
jgi:hypothetical protein